METMNKYNIKCFVALQGNKSPQEYISLGKNIEELGFDRIYVYDDLPYYPVWSILSLIAVHTKHIELGPAIVSGLHSHPLNITRDAVFLNELSEDRLILGIGKGAFFDLIEKEYSDTMLSEVCSETIEFISRIFNKDNSQFDGKYLKKEKNLDFLNSKIRNSIPMMLGSCDKKMAYFAGQSCDEFQTGGIWNLTFLKELHFHLQEGSKLINRSTPRFSTGGITCVSKNAKEAYELARSKVALYLPYSKSIINDDDFPLSKKEIEKIKYYVETNNTEKAVSYISDEIVDYCALVGTPDTVVHKLKSLIDTIGLYGFSFGAPYGTCGTIEENLKFIKDEVISKLK